MRHLIIAMMPLALTACLHRTNADYSAPIAPEIARSFALRDRYDQPKHVGHTAIFVDSLAVHHIRSEASTIVWRNEAGNWERHQVSEIGPGGLLPVERKLETNITRQLIRLEGAALDRLIADGRLYHERARQIEIAGVGVPKHVMAIVTPFGRTIVRWRGRLLGVSGAVADIALGKA